MIFSSTRLIAAIVMLLATTGLALAEKRVALVIGNSDYAKVEKLKNPANDARKLAETLTSIGFDKVTLKLDQRYGDLRRTLGQFARDAAGSDVALIYFAGHGIEVGGTNYVIPTDAALGHVDDVEFEAVELSKLMRSLSRAGRLKLVILDACRNNPFKQTMASIGTNRSVGRGLARVNPAGSDTLVAYAAKEGTVAADGSGENSPYAAALIKNISTPGLDVRLLFGRVRDEVLASTGRRQEPFTYGSLGGDAIYLKPPELKKPRYTKEQLDQVAWAAVKDTTDTSMLRRFIKRNPDNSFNAQANERIKQLERKRERERIALRARIVWNAIKTTGSIRQLRDYVAQFPDTAFAEQANARIASLVAESAARQDAEAKRMATAKQGRADADARQKAEDQRRKQTRADQIRQAAISAAWSLVSTSSDPVVLNGFIAQYPNSQHVDAARARIAELKQRQKVALLQPDASVPDINKADTDTLVDPRRLALDLQRELNRLGCNAGTPDGAWGNNSRRALKAFTRHAKVQLASLEPSRDIIDELKSRKGRVCPLACSPRHRIKGNRCVLKTCGTGKELDRAGRCVQKKLQSKDKPKNAKVKVQKRSTSAKCGMCRMRGNAWRSRCGVVYRHLKSKGRCR